MAQEQEWPSFEDLEPEGEDVEAPDSLAHAEEFKNDDLDETLLGTLGEYEFGETFEEFEEEFDDQEDDEFFGNGHGQPARRTLANLAARQALTVAGRATTTAIFSRDRRKPGPRRPAHPLEELFDDQYLTDELDGEWFDNEADKYGATVCSAGLQEARELMEKLATAAASARSKAEAERLGAAIVPLALQQFPNFYRALWTAIPALILGTGSVTRLLHSRPGTRPLIRKLPAILHSSVAQLARHIEQGRPVTQRLAAQALARQIAATWPHRSGRGSSPAASRRSKLTSHGRY